MKSRDITVYATILLFWLAYAALTFLSPSTGSRQLGLSDASIVLIRVTIAIPYLAAWLAGAYCALILIDTSGSMPDKEDAIAYRKIGIGVGILLVGLVLSSVIGAARTYMMAVGGSSATLAIITNYIYIFFPLAGFAYIFAGGGHLRQEAIPSRSQQVWGVLSSLMLLAFAAIYTWLIFTNPTRQVSADPAVAPTYFLPDFLIILTIVLPFIASCVIALLAILRITRYYGTVSGYLYKKTAINLINGLLSVMAGSLLLQALLSLGSTRLLAMGIGLLLFLIYLFVAVQTLGFILLAAGARRLGSIERVMKKYEAPV